MGLANAHLVTSMYIVQAHLATPIWKDSKRVTRQVESLVVIYETNSKDNTLLYFHWFLDIEVRINRSMFPVN